MRVELPDKLFFKIGEVASLTDIKPHVLRYWESEFSCIRPQKSKTNQRLYRRTDVEAVLAVKHLLYDRKFTIEGAKRQLKDEGVAASLPAPDPGAVEQAVRRELTAEIEDRVAAERAAAVRDFEKQLLSIRQDVERFLAGLDESPES